MGVVAEAVEGMREYYARRAAYYERVYFKPERQADLRAMEAWLSDQFVGRRVFEVACGTGWWTPHGARKAASWLATDVNPETLAIARAKTLPACVRFAQVDAYTLAGLSDAARDPSPDSASFGDARDGVHFDAAYAGCWWSHVPLSRLRPWLETLHSRLAPGARVVFLDNNFVQTSSTPLSRCDAEGNTYQQRVLDDGSTHEVLKNFPAPEDAITALGPRAVQPRWMAHTHYWILSYRLR